MVAPPCREYYQRTLIGYAYTRILTVMIHTFSDAAIGVDEVATDRVARLLDHLQLHLQFCDLPQGGLLLSQQLGDLSVQVVHLLLVRSTADKQGSVGKMVIASNVHIEVNTC